MKKIIALTFIITFCILGCTKADKELITHSVNQRVLIKVDAEHIDGDVISSPIVVVY